MFEKEKNNITIPDLPELYWINLTNIVIDEKYENIISNIINSALTKDNLINIDKNIPWHIWNLHKLEESDYVKLNIRLFKDNKKIIIEFQRYNGDHYLFHDIVQLIAKELLNFNITDLKIMNKNNNIILYKSFNITNSSKLLISPQFLSNELIDNNELNILLNNDILDLNNDVINNDYIDSTSNTVISLIYILNNIIKKNLNLLDENKNIIESYIHKSIHHYEIHNYIASLRYIVVLLCKYKEIDINRFNIIFEKYKINFNNYMNDNNLEMCTKKNIQILFS
jgi:hypothetical protein